MRRLGLALFLGLAVALTSIAPAFANNQKSHGDGASITASCSLGEKGQIDINGNFHHNSGHEWVLLVLWGSNDGHHWFFTGEAKSFFVVLGKTNYPFSFNTSLGLHFTDYKVSGDNQWSRVINRDECGFRVPEAPSSALLLLGALPAAGLIAVKATGVKVPLPHLHRIA
jgi:hypothetical protein